MKRNYWSVPILIIIYVFANSLQQLNSYENSTNFAYLQPQNFTSLEISEPESKILTKRTTVQLTDLNFMKQLEQQKSKEKKLVKSQPLKIAFGSCYGMGNRSNEIFKTIGEVDLQQSVKYNQGNSNDSGSELQLPSFNSPDLFVWTGDVAYTDDPFSQAMNLSDGSLPLKYIREQYNQTESDPYYSQMKKAGTKIIGVWDDHDYGVNNGNKDFKMKELTREIFLDFVDEPIDSPRRLENQSPIYQDYFIDVPYKTQESDGRNPTPSETFKVHIILLDNRFDYDKATGNHLGDAQFEWLEQTLIDQQSSDLTLIFSGIAIQQDNIYELDDRYGWGDKKRIYDIIDRTNKSGVVFLTGDVHYAMMMQGACKSLSGGYAIPEIISSGLTHIAGEENIIGDFKLEHVFPFLQYFIHSFFMPVFSGESIKFQINYGLIEIDPHIDPNGNKIGNVTFQVKDANGFNLFKKSYDTQSDLIFQSKFRERNQELCTLIQTDQLSFMQLYNYVRTLVLYPRSQSSNINEYLSFSRFLDGRKGIFAFLYVFFSLSMVMYIYMKLMIRCIRIIIKWSK